MSALSRRRFLASTGALLASGCVPDLPSASRGLGDAEGCMSPPSAGRPLRAIPEPLDLRITRWRQDPHAFGSYSFLARGATLADREHLRRPVADRLFFAGEATSSGSPSTVDGALISGRDAAEAVLETDAARVAVIGAGFAGLGAAERLAAEGLEVEVFESRARTGGRVWTDRSMGLPLELGASWIHGIRGNPLTRLADRVGAERFETDYCKRVVRGADGRVLQADQLPAGFEDVAEIEQEYAADIDELSPEADAEGGIYGGPDVLLPGGYDRLLTRLEGPYTVHLSAAISRVEHGRDGVWLEPAGSRFDAAVVTVPLGVLEAGTLAFSPALPQRKREAIERLGMGLLDKVYLRFDEPFWDVEAHLIGFAGPRRGRFATWLNLVPVLGEPILMAFHAASVAEALARRSDREIIDEALGALASMYAT